MYDRPNSRSGMPNATSNPNRLGTSMNRPPGTGRLRTGQVSAVGTQAAQGISLQSSISIADRPMTGQGMSGMRNATAAANSTGQGGRLVEDAAYYIGLTRKRITDITNEINKLNNDIDTISKESVQMKQLEKKYETLIKSKETLEGQLADYNFALDKIRTSTDPDDVKHLAMHINEKNSQARQELDRMFLLRKQKESEVNEIEDNIEGIYHTMQAKIDNELEPGRRRVYNESLNKQRELQERSLSLETKLHEINSRIHQIETDDKSSALRKEFSNLERKIQMSRKEYDNLQQEMNIANLEPKEASARFMSNINELKNVTKALDDKCILLQEEITTDKKHLEELNNSLVVEDNGDNAKYELLVKRDQEMTIFMDQFDETRNDIISEHMRSKELIVALLEHISKGIEDSNNVPSRDEVGEMNDAKAFKEKNLASAERTMESLQVDFKKRQEELDLLKESEPRLIQELQNLKDSMIQMKEEMKMFQDIEGLRQQFEKTQAYLIQQKQEYRKRRDSIRQQVQMLSSEHESLKKMIASNDIAKDLDEIEKRLRNNEKTIFELKEFIEAKSYETDYDTIKVHCVQMVDTLNSQIIKNCLVTTSMAGAKGKW